ncbi:type II secretion system protein N [Thiohalomonas denitrificans]|uniref:Type II secretion system protein N n=1 Tax=Thiohalomonas denitrificans TaxID=415747 RepID=A0A1G5QTJ6_9GAMM|nr:type II secretion system protein N [Thiohalomonas denitrificans]SCZ64898.1 type II secretion system protein N (GspN) [Thiohalomonas denitrificans]
MKRTVGYLALGLVAYLLFAVMMLPAQKALGFAVPQLKSQGVSIAASGVAGSIWSGRMDALSVNGFGLQQIRWDLNPLSLLTGRIGGDWNMNWQGARLQGYASATPDGRALLKNVQADSPADEFAGFIPIPLSLGGNITLDLQELRLEEGRPVSAEGTAIWTDAAFIAPLDASLGDLRVVLKPREGGGVDAEIQDGGGPLRLEGTLKLEPNGTYRLNANLGTRPGASSALEENLAMLGRRNPEGFYNVVHQGRI